MPASSLRRERDSQTFLSTGFSAMNIFTTPDLSDDHPEACHLRLSVSVVRSAVSAFSGRVSTVSCEIDNSRVAEAVSEPGKGRVLLVDGKGLLHRSLLGDRLAQLASDNGWAGVIVIGAIRDVEVIERIDLGVQALGVCPVKTQKQGRGERDIPLAFVSITVRPGDWLYADRNGVLVSSVALLSDR